MLVEQVEALGIPGAQLGVLSGGELTTVCAGLADLRSETSVRPSTTFQIASVTKPMNALAAARLAAAGSLDFDSPLDRAIPELEDAPWAGGVVVEDLLTNVGGLPMSERTEFEFEVTGDDGLSRLASELARGTAAFPAGSCWSYSNAAACLLGRLIEVLTDLSYEDALRQELYEPLGMTATGFLHDRPPTWMATGYQAQESPEEPPAEATLWSSRALGPAGTTVWSNVGDLLRMARTLVEPEDTYLPQPWPSWLLELTVDLTIPPFMDAWCRALSMFRWPGGPVWGWLGVCSGFRAYWLLLPTRSCATALLVNSDRGAELYRALLPSLMAELGVNVPPAYPAPPRARDGLSRYCGRYAWPDSEILVELELDGVRMSGAAEGHLVPIDDQLFRWPTGDPDFPFVTFAEPDSDGKSPLLYHAVWAYPRA